MKELNVLAIVLSRNYSTGLGVIRSLGCAGYTVDLISSVKKKGSSIIASSSKYIRKSIEVLTPNIQGSKGEELIDEIMKYSQMASEEGNVVIIFPTDDFTASVVDFHRDALEGSFVLPSVRGGKSGDLVRYMDKLVQSSFAENAGLLTPKKWTIGLEHISIPEDMIYPCYVKPLQSILGSKSEMKACFDYDQLAGHLQEMARAKADRWVLVEEYLSIDKEYDLSGVCLDQEIIIPAVIEKTHISKHENGVTMAGRLVSKTVLGDMIVKIENMLRQFGYTGMFDMELNQCGEKIYFNEINFRSGGPNFSYFLNGVNLPDIFVKHCIGKEIGQAEKEIKDLGKTFVYEKVAWEDYIYSHMTKRELKECIKSADFTLLASHDDPNPGKVFSKRIRLSAIKNKLKNKIAKAKPAGEVVNRDFAAGKKDRAIILGYNYGNILAMTRALGKHGYDIKVIRLHKKKPRKLNPMNNLKPDKYSKYVSQFTECETLGDENHVIDLINQMIETGNGNKPLIIPVDDFSASLVDKHLDKLKEDFVVPNVGETSGKLTSLMDKNCQKELAKAFGLPVVDSILIKSINGEFEIPQEVKFPCFIKPNVSANSTKDKMKKCMDHEELQKTLRDFATDGDFEILVEDYINIQTEYSLLGISAGESVIAPCMFKATKGGHRERKGVAMMGETVETTLYRQLVDQCTDFIGTLDYTGMFDVDFIEDEKGNMYFVELNFRAGASVYGFIDSGVNLPSLYADYLLKDIPFDGKGASAKGGALFLSEKILIEEYLRNDVSLGDVRRYMDEADVLFIKDKEDPAPYSHFRKYFTMASILRVPYGIRDGMR